VTKTVSDEYVFRVPPLRNIEPTPPYFHTGKSWDLCQAVAVMGTSQLGQTLSDEEITKITAYHRSLTGKQPQVTDPYCRRARKRCRNRSPSDPRASG
jgi:cytochrome c peroxidase